MELGKKSQFFSTYYSRTHYFAHFNDFSINLPKDSFITLFHNVCKNTHNI